MKKVNFITNIPPNEHGGGMSAVSYSTHQQLKRFYEVNYVGPINPPPVGWEHILSKMTRLLGGRGKYFFFSDRRLKKIASAISERIAPDAHFNFFHGFASWTKYKSNIPYFGYCDACFATYVRLYNNIDLFRRKDLERIYNLEKEWLSNARTIFFHSQWALEETRREYNMAGANFRVAGVGGFIDKIPETDNYSGGHNILFISRLFSAKGGDHCFNALQGINMKYPDVTLTILGEAPPENVLKHPQVNYVGFLKKSIPEQFDQYKKLLESAWLLMHPTTMDVNPLVVAEAGYYGCPSVATRSFAIPELVRDKETGFLVDAPVQDIDLVDILGYVLENEQTYLAMRKAVKDFTTNNLSWNKVGDHLHREMEK